MNPRCRVPLCMEFWEQNKKLHVSMGPHFRQTRLFTTAGFSFCSGALRFLSHKQSACEIAQTSLKQPERRSRDWKKGGPPPPRQQAHHLPHVLAGPCQQGPGSHLRQAPEARIALAVQLLRIGKAAIHRLLVALADEVEGDVCGGRSDKAGDPRTRSSRGTISSRCRRGVGGLSMPKIQNKAPNSGGFVRSLKAPCFHGALLLVPVH